MLYVCCCWQVSGLSVCCATHLLGTGLSRKAVPVALANMLLFGRCWRGPMVMCRAECLF